MSKFKRWLGRSKSPIDLDLRQQPISFPMLTHRRLELASGEADFAHGDLPRFRLTANDQAGNTTPTQYTRARTKFLEAFTPSQPIDNRERFAGRAELMESLIRAIEEQRLHVVLYGARGLGKTSAMHVLAQAARDARYLVIYVSCGSDSNFDEVFRTVASNIPMLFHSSVGPTSPEVENGKSLADILPAGPISARLASDYLAKVVGTRVVVILDEFDRCGSEIFRRDIAELIKNLSDRLVRVQLVIAGVAADLVDLLENIPSIQRNIRALPVPWMTPEEIQLLIQRGETLSGVRFDSAAVGAIVKCAQGSPYLASLLSHHSGLCALERESTAVSFQDVVVALSTAAGEFKSRLSSQMDDDVLYLVREGYLGSLGTIAGFALKHGGIFRCDSASDVDNGGGLSKQVQETASFLVARGILTREQHGSESSYRFIDESVAPYLWLISSERDLEEGAGHLSVYTEGKNPAVSSAR